MANLLSQDIGLNYKGLINIGSTINQNISASLQSLTDGDGNLLPLEISTTQMSVGGATGTGRLIVRGDGTNPIFRAENNSGVQRFSIPNAGAITTNSDISIPANNLFTSGSASFSGTGSAAALYWSGTSSNGRVGVNSGGVFIDYGGTTKTNTSGTLSLATLTSAFGAAAGSANFRPLNINYTINNSGAQTGTMTGIYLNATETALNGMTHNLMDLQVGGISRFRVSNTGVVVNRTDGAYDVATFTNSGLSINSNLGLSVGYLIGTAGSRLYITTNTTIGSNVASTASRLLVRGDGTNPIFRFETSAGVNAFTLDATGANLNFNPGLITASMELRATHYIGLKFYNNYNQFVVGPLAVAGTPLYVQNYIQTANYASFGSLMSSGHYAISADMSYAPSSGSITYEAFRYTATINQTGTANGITRGLYIKPTLTSAVDFRAIETNTGSTSAHKLLYLTNAANERVLEINAAKEIGFFGSSPSAQLDVSGSRSNPEEALANLLTALATYGIIVDATTA